MNKRMAVRTWALWPLLVGSVLLQVTCQHWSFGLSPGGKRDLDTFSDTLDNVVEGFPHMDAPCRVVGCADESPFAKIYRMKGFLGGVTDRENGRRVYKK
ncbi:progonadoliberin-1-like [Odontesthes bonariensis]|uniref:progonadoliberin-1-like n=1 Tax=Odontesthes bonariensis TaxID=219752 RepID=UPI000044ED4F